MNRSDIFSKSLVWFSMTSSRDDESEEEQLPKNTAIADSKIIHWAIADNGVLPTLSSLRVCYVPKTPGAPSCESVGNLAYEVDMIVRLI